MILEILLTITAWKRGWRWWALLPVAIVFGTAFLAGVVIGASGSKIENPDIFVIFDLLLIITQAVLTIVPKRAKIPKTVVDSNLSAVIPDKSVNVPVEKA